MGFKVDASFLRFLTMGALGVRRVASELKARGFDPIELERYCSSNKIWTTKIKRLRLPDLLCVRTGLRIEVRAKSNLMIRMSDAPNNPERRWGAGLRDEDVVALIACSEGPESPVPADGAVYFRCGRYAHRSGIQGSDRQSPPRKEPNVTARGHPRFRNGPALCYPSMKTGLS